MKQDNKTTEPFCIFESVIGNINITMEPNRYYAQEVKLNGKRINLPGDLLYGNIKKIILHLMNPIIGTIYTNNNNKIAVIYKQHPFGACFEILGNDTSL